MPIYFIEAKDWEHIRDLEFEDSGIVYKKRYRRAVVFCRDELEFPRAYHVTGVEPGSEPGQTYEDACKSWLGKLTVIDDLVSEFLMRQQSTSAGDMRQMGRRSEQRWRKARGGLELAEDRLLEAEEELRQAAAEFVRTHGRGPFGLYDAVWYLSCALEPYPHVMLQDLSKQWKRKIRAVDKRRTIRRRVESRKGKAG